VIVAAAVAVVGFGAAAATKTEVVPWLLAAAGAASAMTALLALYARQEKPWLPGPKPSSMEEALRDAETAVGAIYSSGHFTSAEEAYRAIFAAWHAVSSSCDARRKRKQILYALAVLGLLVELGLVLALLATAGT
jgi:hypothetical protein